MENFVAKMKRVHTPEGDDFIPYVFDAEYKLVATTWDAMSPAVLKHALDALRDHLGLAPDGVTIH